MTTVFTLVWSMISMARLGRHVFVNAKSIVDVIVDVDHVKLRLGD